MLTKTKCAARLQPTVCPSVRRKKGSRRLLAVGCEVHTAG